MEPMGDYTTQTKTQIVDFLYRDLSKIDSFYAQIFQGNLIAVSKLQEETTGGQWSLSGGIPVIKGSKTGQKGNKESVAEQIEPHDAKTMLLLEELAIPVFEDSLTNTETGQIVLLQGEIALRNYQTIKSAIPHLLEAGLLKTKSEFKKQKQIFTKLLNLLPGGLEIEILTSNKELATGPINPNYLTINPDDLLRLYGNFIPGIWFVLGIINHRSSRQVDTEQDNTAEFQSPADFRKALDQFASAIATLYSSGTTYTISPILIFRELQYKSYFL